MPGLYSVFSSPFTLLAAFAILVVLGLHARRTRWAKLGLVASGLYVLSILLSAIQSWSFLGIGDSKVPLVISGIVLMAAAACLTAAAVLPNARPRTEGAQR